MPYLTTLSNVKIGDTVLFEDDSYRCSNATVRSFYVGVVCGVPLTGDLVGSNLKKRLYFGYFTVAKYTTVPRESLIDPAMGEFFRDFFPHTHPDKIYLQTRYVTGRQIEYVLDVNYWGETNEERGDLIKVQHEKA